MVRSCVYGFSALVSALFLALFLRYASSLGRFLWPSGVFFVILLFVVLVSLFHKEKSSAFFMFSSVLMFLSVLYLRSLGQSFSFALSLLALIQFMFALSFSSCRSMCFSCDAKGDSSLVSLPRSNLQHSVVFVDGEGKKTVALESDTKKVTKSTGSHASSSKPKSLGLFVASRKGKYFHAKGSEWAQKIKPENQVWFTSQKEAQDAGYTPSSDLKN